MKLTNEEIYYAGQGIQQLGGIKLPLNTSIQIAKLAAKLTKTTKPIEKERKAIVNKYNHAAEKDERNQPKPLDLEQREAMQVEIDALMEVETDFEFSPKDAIKLPQKVAMLGAKLGELEDFKIEPNILALLMPFIEV
jgi:methylmalonyl-CoA mutase N-terminal domain/subunit